MYVHGPHSFTLINHHFYLKLIKKIKGRIFPFLETFILFKQAVFVIPQTHILLQFYFNPLFQSL